MGLVYDFERRLLRHKPRRVWRLVLATRALLRRSRLRGEHLMIWIGHAVHLFQLTPCVLSALNAVYHFVHEAEGRRPPVWPAIRFELRLVLGLLMLSEVNLALEFSPKVYTGDSANNGYALLSIRATPIELREACTFKERCCFAAVPVDSVPPDLAGGVQHRGRSFPSRRRGACCGEPAACGSSHPSRRPGRSWARHGLRQVADG